MRRLSRSMFVLVALLGMLLPGCGFHHPSHRSGDYDKMWAGVERTVLPNGLTLVTQEVHSSSVVCVYVYYKVGSRYEKAHQHGISHLLEHMMFKGSTHYPLGEMDRLYSNLGATFNGDTEQDYTSYHGTLPASGLATALKVEADRMQNLTLDKGELEREKSVVLSELDGDDNSPKERLDKAVDAAAFTVHPYHNPVIGYAEEVKALTVSDLKQYYREHYAPNNAVLVVVGDFKTAALRQEVGTDFGSQQRRPLVQAHATQEPIQRQEHRVNLFETGKLSHIEIGYHMPPCREQDSQVLYVISYVLAAGDTSRFNNDLLDRKITAGQNADVINCVDPHLFKVTATVRQGRSLSEVEHKLEWELQRLATEPVPDGELDSIRAKMLAQWVFTHVDVRSHANILGYRSAVGWEQTPAQWLSTVESVTPAEIQKVASRYFKTENRTVGWLWATGDSGKTTGSAPKNQPKVADESPGDTTAVRLTGQAPDPAILKAALLSLQNHPPVNRQTLPNGLTVLIYPDHASPEISISCGIKAGSLWDPPGRPGTAYFAVYGLQWGTKTQSGWQLATQMDEMGAEINRRFDTDGVTFTCRCLQGDLPPTLDVLADEIRNPAYSPDSVVELKKNAGAAEMVASDDPKSVAWKGLDEALYPPDSPYHWYDPGTPEIRSQITPAGLHLFHDTYYRPDRTVVVIVGDIDKDAALAEVSRTFGSWAAGSGINPPISQAPSAIRGGKTIFHMVPGAHEADVLMGFGGIERGRPDYYAALMANDILSGTGRSSRLWQHLRQEQGLVYHVSSGWVADLVAGPWTVSFGCSPSNVDHAVGDVIGDIKRMQTNGVSIAELNVQQSRLAGLQAVGLQTHGNVAGQLLYAEFYGLGTDHPWRLPSLVAQVTPEQVHRAAQQLFHPEDMVVSVAGPP